MERMIRFQDAYDTLASPSSRQPKEANDIIAVLQAEVDAVNKALENLQGVCYSSGRQYKVKEDHNRQIWLP